MSSSKWNKDIAQEQKREMRKKERARLKADSQSGEWTTILTKTTRVVVTEEPIEPITKIPRFNWADE
jgi:hypothetical protein